MAKITFMGAGSTVFARNILGDCMCSPVLADSEIALYDIESKRLSESEAILNAINKGLGGKAAIKSYLGVDKRKDALRGANFVVNAIQVGLYDPCTITDFEVPKKYGLRQTISDTLGIGGIMRALRTIPVLADFARDMEEVCPNAWFLNYTNPMSMLAGYMQRYTGVKTIGLCHSVQVCSEHLLMPLGMEDKLEGRKELIAGINHMGWLLELKDKDGNDLYPEIRKRAADMNAGRTKTNWNPWAAFLDNGDMNPERKKQVEEMNAHFEKMTAEGKHWDMVRYDYIDKLGFYCTESSEHNAEYSPFYIKSKYPELIDRYNIPLDEYPRRCVNQLAGWDSEFKRLTSKDTLEHKRSYEYASCIMEALITGVPYKIGGNVLNSGGLIENLPREACVEVPCMVDSYGINPCYVGKLPVQLAAMNMTHVNVHLITIEAAVTLKKEHVYHAAMLDPHTAAELSLDDIHSMVDDLIEEHGDWLPKYI